MTLAILDARDREYVVVAAGADLISTYVQQAIAAGQTAQEVLDAILAAGLSEGVFPSLAAGESGTTAGQYFWVGEGGTVVLYRNDAGVGTEIAELATMASLAGKVDAFTLAASGGAALVGSADGNVQSDIDDLNETAASLLSLVPNSVTGATAFDTTGLNQTFIVSGSSSFLINLPPAGEPGDAIKVYAARGYTGLCAIQAASGSGLTVDGLTVAYLISGEGGNFVYDGTGWVIMDRVQVPLVAEMRNSGSTSLTTGSFGQVPFPAAGTQMMQADLKALWGYSGGYFTAPRPGTFRLTVSVWLNHSGSGQYDVGAYIGSTTGGTPSDTQFARVSVDSSTYRTIQYAGEFAMVAGDKLYVSVRPLTVTSAKVEDSAILMSRIVVEELTR